MVNLLGAALASIFRKLASARSVHHSGPARHEGITVHGALPVEKSEKGEFPVEF